MEVQVVRVVESYLLAPALYLSAGLFNLKERMDIILEIWLVLLVAVVVAPAAVSIYALTP
jgi:hypothetical protein